MKKTYLEPALEIEQLMQTCIMTTSGDDPYASDMYD